MTRRITRDDLAALRASPANVFVIDDASSALAFYVVAFAVAVFGLLALVLAGIPYGVALIGVAALLAAAGRRVASRPQVVVGRADGIHAAARGVLHHVPWSRVRCALVVERWATYPIDTR